MRVATNAYTDSMLNQFNVLVARQNSLANQASTGLSLQSPSDNPVAMQSTLDDLSQQAAQTQYSANIATLQTRATSIANVMQSLQAINSRAGEIATLAGSPTASPADLTNYASEVKQLIQQAAQLMNSQDPASGQYLFGGTNSTQAAYAITTDAGGNVTGVTYQGNTNVADKPIADGTTAAVDVPGSNTTGTGPQGVITDSRTGADFFNHLISLQNHLLAGDTASISSTDTPALGKDENNIISQISNNGAIQTQLETAQTANTQQATSLTQLVSTQADANITDTIVQLNQAQYAYQAALQSGAGIMQKSLLDYLP